MGPTHAMSGAFLALLGTATYSVLVEPVDPVTTTLITVMASGAALAPDWDSNSATAVRSFGIFGQGVHTVFNAVGVTVHSLTRKRRDEPVTNGHRTFFHTTFMAIAMGLLTAFLTSLQATVNIFGHEMTWGALNAIILMGIFLNLALAGLLEKQIKKARKLYGPYVLMAFSFLCAVGISFIIPEDQKSYAFLGIAVGAGWFFHLLGDAITKDGVPLAWPVPINGKRWWDVSLPSFMRIRAGGKFEYAVLLPFLTLGTFVLVGLNIYLSFGGSIG